MHIKLLRNLLLVFVLTASVRAQQPSSCAKLTSFKAENVDITKSVEIAAGTTEAIPWRQTRTASLPAYCRVEGLMDRRTGVNGEEFGITFALAMPDQWNGDFLMQGGAGSNGVVMAPLGVNAAGDTPALKRGFAVVSTDSGHQSHHPGFDFDFIRDQQAYLDFAYLANVKVAALAKQLIAHHYGKAPAFSYFSGCSTGGREGMILSQRYPTVFNGIISGDPAMRTGLSNLAIGRWVPIAFNQIAPRDANGKPIIEQSITDDDRKLIREALIKQCDAKDGIADGLISDQMGCDFDPEVLVCKGKTNASCLASEKVLAIKKVMGGPKTTSGTQVYAGFLYDTGITNEPPLRGLLSPGPGIFGPATADMAMDVDREALAASQPLVDSMSTNLTTFSTHGGKLIFYHGDSDPWFSPLDTFEYFKNMAAANGGLDGVSKWSQFYFVPGMSHCGGGQALDQFDLLDAIVNWVEKGTLPSSVIATGKAFPGRSRPLCPYPKHAQYKGRDDTQDAANFDCR